MKHEMTYEEIIENLKYLVSIDGCDTYYDFVEEIEASVEALEKQIPKKPILKGMHYECECGNWLLYTDETPQESDSFCSRCGHAIDWSEVK